MNFKVILTEEASRFIVSLPVKMQAKIQRTIDLLKEFGYMLPKPHSKKLIGIKDLFELRIKLGNNVCRLFYFHWKNKIYVITSGYMKKSRKTDQSEIKKAVNAMNSIKGCDNHE